ncbi:ribonuclease III [Chloroflexota bacterium]
MTDLGNLQSSLGINFKYIPLLQQSLVHRSYLNENPELSLKSNERLEFLGDAVLGFVATEMLYSRFPSFSEGDLTKLRATLVCGETLARVALSLRLGDYLYLGHGEEDSGGRYRSRNLSCTIEAIIGAIFLDQGLKVVKGFILRILSNELEQALEDKIMPDYKSKLQQIIQSKQKITPVYRTLEEAGPGHAPIFTVEVMARDSILGKGQGQNKRTAEMEAARTALEALAEKEE